MKGDSIIATYGRVHYIYKEEISQELDFKLRQYLIQNFDLYKKVS